MNRHVFVKGKYGFYGGKVIAQTAKTLTLEGGNTKRALIADFREGVYQQSTLVESELDSPEIHGKCLDLRRRQDAETTALRKKHDEERDALIASLGMRVMPS